MTKNKFLLCLLALILCLSLAAFAAAEPEEEEHVHTYGDWYDVQPATCTTPRLQERLCTVCQKADAQTVGEPLGHDFEWYTEQDADCKTKTNGLKEKRCSRCGLSDEAQVIPWSHTPGPWTPVVGAEVTCTTDGFEEQVCSVCGEALETRPVTATGHKWDDGVTTKEAKPGVPGVKTFTCSVCGDTMTEEIPALPKRPSTPSTTEQPVAEDIPALPYGSIVSDVTRAAQPYEAEIVEEAENHVLVITAEPDETGVYVLRNLHIDDELLAKLAADHIEIVRFVVGTATVEFPAASFTGEVMTTIKADLASPAKEFIITVDPTATTAEGNPGCSVSASIACEDGSEFDITGVVEGLTVTMNGVAQAVTAAAVYAA